MLLADSGFCTFAVDNRVDALRDAAAAVSARGGRLRAWCADLTAAPLPERRFELLLVTRYLQRDLFPALKRAVVPRGFIVYETFTESQRAHGTGPTSADHLLRAGELREQFADCDVLFYEEVTEPEAVARIVARTRG